MAEATIDELQIEISTSSGSAAGNLDDLAKSLDRLQAVTSRITSGSDGLNKVAKQIEKLNAISQKIQSMRGFEKLGKMVDQLSKLDRLSRVGDISGFVRNANKLPQAVNALAQMPSVDPTKFQQLADALKPLQTVNSSGINSLMNALRKLPKVSQELSGVDFTRLTQQIEQISRAIEPLARQAERSGQGLTAIAQIMQQTNRTARQSTDGVSLFNRAVGDIKVKTLAAVAALRRLFSALKSGVTASAAYVENLNLFSVTMGDSADEALRFAESVNSALGVDTSDWIRYQGVFQSIGKGFGIISEKADVMSKNLTQLTYDVSSFYNVSVDTAAMKLQSAMSGQVMPMRELGFAIEETTLKQVALNHGIEMSVENMTQAQKAQLRYIAIMEQAGNIGVLGDMARTIDTASNGMRVFQARIQQFSRAVGNMLMPILSTALPYMTAFVQVLTEGAQAIANFFGFELPKIDFSDAQVSSGFDDITGAIDEATEANEKFKGSLASIDQLNIIGSDSESKNATNMGNQFDLGITLPEYDFLQGVESKTKQIAENIKDWFKEALPWIEAVGTAILGVFATRKALDFVSAMKRVSDVFSAISGTKLEGAAKAVTGIAGGLAAGATSGTLLFNGIKNLITGTGKLGNNWAMVGGGIAVAVGAVTAFIKLGNPVGAVITSIGAAVGIIVGINEGLRELDNQLAETITYADNGGISIEGLATGYENYFDTITEGYDDIIANNEVLELNAGKTKTAADNILGLTDNYRDMNTVMTSEDAATIKTNIEEIGTAVQTWLGTETSTLIDTLTTKFSTFAEQLGMDIDGLSGKLKLLQGIGESKIEQYQQQSFDLVDKLTSDQLSPDEFQNTLDELDVVTQKMKIPDITAEATSFTKALQDMQNAAVNIGEESKALDAIEELGIKADDARAKIKEAQAGQMANLQSLMQYYKQIGADVDFDAKMKANGIDLTFDSLFTGIEKTLDQGYATELKKIDIGEAAFATQVYSQLEKNATQFAENEYASNGATFESWIANPFDPVKQKEASMTSYKVDYWESETTKKLTSALSSVLNGLNIDDIEKISDYIIQGMAGGIIKNQSDFDNALTAAAIGGLDALKTALGIASPSKKGEEITDYLMQGLKLGVTENQDLVFSALNYTAVQSIMKLSKLKENMSAFKLGDIDAKSLIPDFSFKAPTISRAAFEQPTGTVREAYENSNIATSNSYDSGNLEATIPVTVQVFLDNDMIMESISEQFANASYRNNGKPMW